MPPGRSVARRRLTSRIGSGAAVALTVLLVPSLAGAYEQVASTPGQTGGAVISTVAGTGEPGRSGDGGPATQARIGHPRGLAIRADGSFLVTQPFDNAVRLVRSNGTVSTVAGTGVGGFSGDGGAATSATLDFVHGVATLPDGSFVLADMFNNRVRRVDARGIITTTAGTGVAGYGGDGGAATAALVNLPRGIAALPTGEILLPDSSNHRVRRIGLDGRITTVAGTGVPGSTGDGGSATAATLDVPFGVAPLPDGGFLVVERRGNRVRRVSPAGTIRTVAGTGAAGYSGDGGPAAAAMLNSPHAVVALPDGGFLVADTLNHRVRRVDPAGMITTLVGTGVAGFGGDGGPAGSALLDQPKALALQPDLRGVLVADAENDRVRLVRVDLRLPLLARFRLRVFSGTTRARPAIGLTLSRAASVELTVLRGAKTVARVRRPAPAGATRLVVPVRLAAGAYALRLVARSGDGVVARDRATLRIAAR